MPVPQTNTQKELWTNDVPCCSNLQAAIWEGSSLQCSGTSTVSTPNNRNTIDYLLTDEQEERVATLRKSISTV
eukprot:258607-Amphidinium_carterae.1